MLVGLFCALAVTCPNRKVEEKLVHRSSLFSLGQFCSPLPSVSRVISFPMLLSASWKCAGPKWTFPGRCFLPWTLDISSGKMYLVVCANEICLLLGSGKSQRDRVLIVSSLKVKVAEMCWLGKNNVFLAKSPHPGFPLSLWFWMPEDHRVLPLMTWSY